MLDGKKLYDHLYKDTNYGSRKSSIALRVIAHLEKIKFDSVLDVGCGAGHSLIHFLSEGKSVRGAEFCDSLLDGELRVMKDMGIVDKVDITEGLPYEGGSFDLVCSFDVLEHLPESEIDGVIKEMIRVSGKYVVNSICFAGSVIHENLHLTVRGYDWWCSKFEKYDVRHYKSKDVKNKKGGVLFYGKN